MKSKIALWSLFCCAACALPTPAEYAAAVRELAGGKPLRVGVVVLTADRHVQAAFAEPPAAPGGAAPLPASAVPYREQVVLPSSVTSDAVVSAVADLAVFTDVVPLVFDARGVASRAAMVQRLQDRLWQTALAQELDAVLVVEGVRDDGLRWSDADEGLFSLDTVLWWLCWPVGLWIPDRSYQPAVALVAELFWVGDARSTPVAVDATAHADARSLPPWQRAAAPLLGLVVPPVWLADDTASVGDAISDWSRAILPIALARQLKQMSFAQSDQVSMQLAIDGGRLTVLVRSGQEITDAQLSALPRGALTEDAARVPVQLTVRQEYGARGTEQIAAGAVPVAALAEAAQPLLRLVVTLTSGERVSRTWNWDELVGRRR